MSLDKKLEILEKLKKEMGLKATNSIPKRTNQQEYPLSYAQERMWFASELNPTSAAYNIPLAIRIMGNVDLEKLSHAFNSVIKKHEILRAQFMNENGGPVQRIFPFRSVNMKIVSMVDKSVADQEIIVKKLVNKTASNPINLQSEQLFNITVFKLSEEEHILLIVMHHIIFDGWSTGLLMKEISEVYRNGKITVDDLVIQYADYSAWQKEKMENGGYQRQVEYWKNKIGSNPPELNLPLDYSRPKNQMFEGDIYRFELPVNLVDAVKQMSREKRVSPFVILLSSYYIFLYKYTGQKELILGVPVSNRQHVEIEPLIGCIANTIPLKVFIESQKTVTELIQQVNKATLEAQDHQELPFDKLVDELKINRTLSLSPVFQSMFVYQQNQQSILELDDCVFIPYDVETKTSKFDLSVSIMETDERIEGFFEYSKLFEQTTIERMVRNYIYILEELIYKPNELVSKIKGMIPEEEQKIISSLEPMSFEKGESIHRRFEQQVRQFPDAVALVSEGTQITYSELDKRANQLARYLKKNGVRTETKVAIKMDRSSHFIISILAVLKAGGTYVPLDPEQPRSRITYIIEDSRCEVLLTQEKYIDALYPGLKCTIIQYAENQWVQEKDEALNIPVFPDQVAYIIYTSGSTGKPKGVLNTHHNVRRLFESSEKHFQFTEKDAWTLFHSTAFDFTVWEIWGALLYGGKLFIIPAEMRRKPELFYRFLHEEGITVLNQTPSAFKELLNSMDQHKYSLKLRYIIFGGEALHFQDLSRWFEKYGDQTKLINMYGITETTVHVTWREVKNEEIKTTARSLIGKPLQDLNIYILDEDLNPVPIGVPGEIYVGGEGLARGYNERYALTAERFTPNPFSVNGDRLYKTGDVGKYISDGDIEYVGRMDDQVKIKGHRIELGEVKSIIAQYPTVKDCTVLVRTNEKNENELAVFVVFSEEDELKKLRKSLLSNLPKYMYPSHLIAVEVIPVTSNGKVDKSLLLKLCENTRVGEKREPETQIEKDLTAIWKTVLNNQEIYLNDNFFSLGGDSIRSLKIISEAEEKGYFFTLEELFQHQTIEELVQLIEQKVLPTEREDTLSPFALVSEEDYVWIKDGVEDAYPLAKAQEGMFYHMEQYPEEPLYHNIDSVLLKGKFDYGLFKKAVAKVVARNVMLRTSFDLKNFRVPMQLVHQTANLFVGYSDIRHLEHNKQEEIINQYIQQEKKNTFDLDRPSLLRFFVHQRSDKTFQFSLTECHLIFDGWSLTSTLAEIFDLYFQLLEGNYKKSEKELSVDFRDFVKLEQEAIQSEEHIAFWKSFLLECQALQLPIYESKKALNQAFRVRRRIVELSKETSRQLKQVSASYQFPVKSILLAAHVKALQAITGQSDVVTGMVSNGRMEKKDGEKVKGLFINTLPFRQIVSHGEWVGLINKTFEIEQDILPYRRLPLPEIQRHVNQSTLFETAFNYVYFHSMEPLLTSNKIEFLGFNRNSANDTHFKLMATFSNHPPDYEIRLTLSYDEGTFTEEQMDIIVDIYHNILKSIATNPLASHDDQSYLPDQVYTQLVHKWNNHRESFLNESLLLHELIEEEAEKSPNSIALIEGSNKITYESLNKEAEKVASFLRRERINGDFIGIYMDRSTEMIIGLLGILKAGCAYVPLDTSYPSERIQYMIRDSKVECILTSKEQYYDLDDLCENRYIVKGILDSSSVQMDRIREKSADQLAYMIYTSGSTGRPKGVMVPHKGVVNRILWMKNYYGKIKNERGLHKTPLSFDYSVFEIFSALCTGASLVIAKPEGHKDSYYLADLIKQHDITTLYFVPTMLQEFLNVSGVDSCTSIQRVMCSGEPLTSQIKEKFFALFSGELYNQYGPTEASVEVTSYRCESWESNVRIGRPMANTEIYILNEDLQPAGIEVVGELYIGGTGLATAYHGNASLTAKHFIPNPFSKVEGARLYKTGDLAKFNSEGEIQYIGRKDSQIKMRGIRVELREIESAIRENPQLKDGIVIYKKDEKTPQGLLVGYVIPEHGTLLTEKEVKNLLRERLPRFMIPEFIVLMQEFPVSPNGKLDKKALPEPRFTRERMQSAYVPPVTTLEKKVARIYQDVLNLDRVGIDDDFFDLGGDSLSAVHLMNRIEKVLGKKVSLDVIYDKPTIKLILDYISEEPGMEAVLFKKNRE
ncbi:non-ribosomal peptide synthetase [Bacillus cereus]|uniref:Non-ribosomal peptide synthetase n=1 Tax=Bacillus cereus TaxID=1396 RepID=A0ABD7DPC4_BACCE|nr:MULTISPECIES: non-ribosomal peptide synthetase [Bacillus cereus group]MCU4934935.1 non-ribosomal peptide synthetase [Bacillus cereus]MCU5457585.1 non-ribosomal peptide synthetase [Bacillus cereus]MCU5503067.1 non-ribosomal peptide synthetase [Bacillus cereus]MCU5510503.1 non-ribosomal peptide synthetase [Bacillus cereus]MCU5551067.1 non-ribosomal peptide synthetase [Bacillus cereus]